jgi:putative ABC transport system permease protein
VRPERLFGWLLRLLPGDFRADYGREMQQVFGEHYQDVRAAGRSPAFALWRQALVEVLRIAPREHLAQLGQDTRFALRTMAGHRAFTAAALVTLALGIGANTAVFSMVWAVLLKPLPYPDADSLVAVWNHWDGDPRVPLSDPDFLDYSEGTRSTHMAAVATAAVNIGGGGDPERIAGAHVSAGLFDVLGTAPVLGRAFREDEEREGASRVAILTEALWQRRFGGDPGVIGRSITVNGASFTVVGVMGAAFRLPTDFRAEQRAQILVPLTLDRAAPRLKRSGHYLWAVARLKPGVALPAARAEVDALVSGLIREYPEEHHQAGFGVALVPLRTDLLGPARPVILVLAAAVGLVLLLTCANVASLLLARAEGRRRELVVRTALGASRFRLVRQLITEATLLSLGGALLGLAVAAAVLQAVRATGPASLPRLDQATLGLPVLAFTMAVAFAAALACGAWPAIQVSRAGVAQVLAEAARGATGGPTSARRLLVAGQVAIAVVLLVGAGLLLKSFSRVRSVPAGFDPGHVLTTRVTIPASRYPGRDEVAGFYSRLLAEIRALPGVVAAGAANGLPLAVSTGDWSFDVEGRPHGGEKHHGASDWFAVTPGYFESLRVPLVRGRLPSAEDGPRGTAVIFLNETAARAVFPGQEPVGQRMRLTSTTGPPQPWRRVAGVVGDVRHRGLERPPRPEIYVPHAQFVHFAAGAQCRSLSIVVRSAAEAPLAAAIRATVRRLDVEVPMAPARTMEAVVQGSLRERRRDLWLIGAFALLALALAAVGLYGLIATTVAQRAREMAVRVALGADRPRVMRLVVGQAMGPVQAGLGAGLLAALLGSRMLRDMLFEVGPRDAGVLIGVVLVLLLVGLLASLRPALRAAQTDPAAALRRQ